MNFGKTRWFGVLAGLAIAPLAWAQAPAIPAIPAGPVAAPAPANLWSFLLPNAQQKAACKTCFCNSALGQLVSGAAGPIAAMSGGLIANRCAQNAIANGLLQPANSSEGAAALVKKDEADAKARRAAVRYLGTVDCSRWPEAEAALLLSLRKDRNECVRWEAAMALGSGCCCTNAIIDALENSVLGENKKDPFPIEKSERVRAAAAMALANCPLLSKPLIKSEEEIKKVDIRPNADPMDYYRKIAQQPRAKVQASARAVLVSVQQGGKPQTVTTGNETVSASAPAVRQRPVGLVGIFTAAFAPETAPVDQPRPPFFSNLTKTLTGKQEAMDMRPTETPRPSVFSPSLVTPMPTPMPVHRSEGAVQAEKRTVMPVGAPAEAPLPEVKIVVPAEGTPATVEVMPAEPTPGDMLPTVPAPIETPTVPAAPAARPAPPPAEAPANGPRESSGSVEVEIPRVIEPLPPASRRP